MEIEAFRMYLSLEKNYSPHTVNAYVRDVKAFSDQSAQWGGRGGDIDEMSYPAIRSWIVSLVEKGDSNRTVNRKVASIKAYYRFLQTVGKIVTNPLSNHKALKTSKKAQVPFSLSEMDQVLTEIEYSEDFSGLRDHLIVHLLYVTGIRRAELINLKLTDVDLHNNRIKVLGKRNKERIVPLLAPTIDLIGRYIEARTGLETINDMDCFFLLDSGNKLYETFVYRMINKYLSKVSIKVKRSPHILRHTFATHLLNNGGADLNSVKELLGHSSLASTQVYTHTSIAELKKVHATAHPRSKK